MYVYIKDTREMHEKLRAKGDKLCFGFVDLKLLIGFWEK